MKALLSKRLIIEWLLSKESMTTKKLQKMMYYEYSWFLVLLNDDNKHLDKTLFKATYQAQVHGPIDPQLSKYFHSKGLNNDSVIKKHGDTHKIENIIKSKVHDRNVLNNVRAIYKIYHKYDGVELTKITQRESPWLTTRKGLILIQPSNRVISNKLIYNYYNKVYAKITVDN